MPAVSLPTTINREDGGFRVVARTPKLVRCCQFIGEALPLTHFLRVIRGILLKGNAFADVSAELWPIAAFAAAALAIGVKRYRQTLD